MAVAMEQLGDGPSARGPVAARSRTDGDAAGCPEVLAEGLHDLVAAQVERTPEAVAVVHGSLTWTYRQLDRRARQLSGQLRRMGVGPDDRVAVCLPSSPELLVGLLGVLGAGAAYVPLSARTPAERAARLLRGTQACCLVTGNPPAVPDWSVPCRVVEVPATDPTPAPDDERPARMRVHPENLAYVIHTSGSTGTPKGVMVSHRAVCNTLRWRQRAFPLGATDRVLVTFDSAFDASVFELFQPLLAGAAVVFPDQDLDGDPDRIIDQVRRSGITVLGVVPSWLALLAGSAALSDCTSLRLLFCGGEPLAEPLVEAVHRRTRARLCNMYGPTEAAIEATYAICRPGEEVHLGRPIDGVAVRVLDAELRPCRPGEVGELFLSGAGLARGYAADPALTAARFLPDPFAAVPGRRMYATGDRCRRTEDGRLVYVGRRDLQVKVNGHRVEVEEVEAALESTPDVREAAVVVREDSAGRRQLIGFVVARPGCEAGLEERVREHLRARLPDHLVPPVLLTIDHLPRTATGKKDRQSLPLPAAGVAGLGDGLDDPVPACSDAVTDLLLSCWRLVLDQPGLGWRDNFFAAGATSIQAAMLAHRLEDALGEYVYAVAIYDAPTVERMAAYLRDNYSAAVARLSGDRAAEGTAAEGARPGRTITRADLDELRACVRTLPARRGRPALRNPPAVFVLSPPRSGTTLLRTMLAGHPQLFAPPELQLLNFQTLRDRCRVLSNGRDDFWLQGTVRALMAVHGVDADAAADHMARCERAGLTVQQFYRHLQESLGDRVLVDKTPTYALDPATLHRAEEDFERPRYIHLVREAGAAVESFLEAKLHVFFPPFFTAPPALAPRALAEAIWGLSHENIADFLSGVDAARVHRVFFDDLVCEPAAVMSRLSRFLEIPFVPATANPYTHDPRTLMTDPVRPLARMLGDVKFSQHGRVRRERADRGGDRPGDVPLGAPTRRIQARLTAHRIRRPSSLTTLRAGAGEPLVLVHPAGGGVACYRHLVARLRPGPQVLAHRGVATEGAPYRSLVELAADYVRDLRDRQARGPYRLCGWSFGGVVAFEMAAQLVTAGEPVAFLSLLDARLHVPGASSLFAADEDLLGAFLRDYEIDHIGEPSPDRPARALAEGQRRGILPPWLSVDDLVAMAARYAAAFQHNIGLARTYAPSARVPRMLVVEAADRRELPAAAAN